MAERARVRIVVSGRVQGVGFRWSTVEAADGIGGLEGWVRNLPDGRVEILAEGERPALEALAAWCRRGPPGARVDDLQLGWLPAAGGLGPFTVQREMW